MKKRNCRKTDQEREQHETATRIRKMTDAKLCDYLQRCSTPPTGGTNTAITDFIQRLDELSGTGNGIGKSTVYKLRKVAVKEGFIRGA